jgi:putative IMPACT (imprinted ancient) family translation regulator
VRYFGGTLLGTSGLIQAYRESAKDALQKAEPLQVFISDTLQITAEYQHDKKVQQVLKQYELIPANASYETAITWTIRVRKTKTENLITDLKSVVGGISKEYAEDTDDIPGLFIKQV